MMDKDAISRALAAHPRPWHSNGFAVYDAEGMLVNAWNWQEFITAIANAYDPQREQHVAALVEALRKARNHIVAVQAIDRAARTGVSYDQALLIATSPDRRTYLVETMDTALAPFTPQEPA
jgi:hypothetical protein